MRPKISGQNLVDFRLGVWWAQRYGGEDANATQPRLCVNGPHWPINESVIRVVGKPENRFGHQ
jgi:hypothetical protein